MGLVVKDTLQPLYLLEVPVPIVEDAGWVPGLVWTAAENLAPLPGIDPRTVQPITSRYTDCAIPTHRT